MILPKLGMLSKAQDLVATTQDSTNVILMSSIDYAAPTGVWLVIDTETIAVGDGADVFDFSLVVSQEEALTTNLEVIATRITGYADARLATAGNRILEANIATMLSRLADSDYDYLGLIYGVTATATLSVNAAISTAPPRTIPHAQTVVSNVSVPARASAAS